MTFTAGAKPDPHEILLLIGAGKWEKFEKPAIFT